MKYANLTLSVALTGSGRPLTITRAPFAVQAFPNTAPPASLSTNSVATVEQIQLQPGNNQIVVPSTYLTGYAPLYYWLLIPPNNSTNPKSLRGAITDQGVWLVTNLTLVLAMPTTPTTMWIYSGNAEVCDSVWI